MQRRKKTVLATDPNFRGQNTQNIIATAKEQSRLKAAAAKINKRLEQQQLTKSQNSLKAAATIPKDQNSINGSSCSYQRTRTV